MKPKPSALQIMDFAVTKLEYEFIPPVEVEPQFTEYFEQYDLDIDFNVTSGEMLLVYISAQINEQRLPGYSVKAEATCIFLFDKNVDLAQDIRRNLEGYSTIYIALNSLRGLISNFTANAPFGRYILPSIDLDDLIRKKKKAIEEYDKQRLPVVEEKEVQYKTENKTKKAMPNKKRK